MATPTAHLVLRRVVIALAWFAAVGGSGMLVLGFWPELQLRHRLLTLAASFVPYGLVAWVFAGVVALVSKRWGVRLLVVPVVAAIVAQVWLARPYWPATAPAASGVPVTVMTQNLYYGWGDAGVLGRTVREVRPDVVAVQEITHDSLARLDQNGWGELLPHRIGTTAPDWDASGTMVFSRYPLTELENLADGTVRVVRVDLPSGPLTVIAVHTTNAVVDFPQWQRDLAMVSDAARRHARGPLVALGDFNAVREHEPMQRLLSDTGLVDAAEQVGRGWMPTWGPGRSHDPGSAIPPVIGVDRVLVRGRVTARQVDAVGVRLSDHQGVVARLGVDT